MEVSGFGGWCTIAYGHGIYDYAGTANNCFEFLFLYFPGCSHITELCIAGNALIAPTSPSGVSSPPSKSPLRFYGSYTQCSLASGVATLICYGAASCLRFFGFMRAAGEFTCSSHLSFTNYMLSPRDISVDSHMEPSMVTVLLQRCPDLLGKNGANMSALLSYMAQRGQSHRPLFVFSDSSPLSRERLVANVREALLQGGVNPALLSSFTGDGF